MPWSLQEMIDLVYSKRPVPSPDKVRLYKISVEGFWDVVSRFRELLAACQRVQNPAFVPPLPLLELYVQAYLRAYLLSCYYDTYLSLGIIPAGFTPSKVLCVLAQPIPKLLLDAMRELIRPVVTPPGLLLIPAVNSIMNGSAFHPDAEVRNGVRLGQPDPYLLKFGIQWFPPLGYAFRAAWMTGTTDGEYALQFVEEMKREGLEPAKAAFVLQLCEMSDEKKKELVASEKVDDFSALSKMGFAKVLSAPEFKDSERKILREEADESKKEFGKVDSWLKWIKKDGVNIEKTYTTSIFPKVESDAKIIRKYFMHDFDAVKDVTRDFAVRILRPLVINLYDDILRGRIQHVIDVTPADLAFLGVDLWRGALPYTVWSFQEIKEYYEGDPLLELGEYYLSRWISTLTLTLKNWHFPSLGAKEQLRPVDVAPAVQISRGRGARRVRRDRGRGRGGAAIRARGGLR